jgi:hypothetical protein
LQVRHVAIAGGADSGFVQIVFRLIELLARLRDGSVFVANVRFIGKTCFCLDRLCPDNRLLSGLKVSPVFVERGLGDVALGEQLILPVKIGLRQSKLRLGPIDAGRRLIERRLQLRDQLIGRRDGRLQAIDLELERPGIDVE